MTKSDHFNVDFVACKFKDCSYRGVKEESTSSILFSRSLSAHTRRQKENWIITSWTRVNTYLQLVSLKCFILHYNSFKMFPLDITDSKWVFVRHIFSKRIFKTNLCLKLNECLNVLLLLSSEVNLQSKRSITWRDLFTIIKSSEASLSMAFILILDHFNPFS